MKTGAGAILVVACCAASPALAELRWSYAVTGATITDLGTFGGPNAVALDINNGGYIVGWATTATGEKHAFYYLSNASYMYDIGAHSGFGMSEARGINNSKEVVGYAVDTAGFERAFYWYAGGHLLLEDAGPAGDGRVISRANAISDSGHIVGQRKFLAALTTGLTEATYWPDWNTFHALSPTNHVTGLPSFVHDVNASGQAVGREEDLVRARRWQASPGVSTSDIIPDAFGASYGDAFGINSYGATVGVNDAFSKTAHAMLWNGVSATATDLGVLPGGTRSLADDINDGHFAVGYGDTTFVSSYFLFIYDAAFIWHQHFGLYVLPRLPGFFPGDCRAHALNERQAIGGLIQVVGYCKDSSNQTRAVRWDVTVTAIARWNGP